MKAKDPYYIAKDIPGGSPKIHLGQGGLDLMQEELMEVNMEYMEQNQPSSIGKYISQGCIRMKKNDVEYLFDRIPIGTKVWIVKSKNHFSNWQKKKELLDMKSQRKGWLFLL